MPLKEAITDQVSFAAHLAFYPPCFINPENLSFTKAPIHILIIPKKPYINFYDFNKNASADEILDFWKLINFIIETKNIENNGFRIITNSGKDGNQDVPHFHVHLLGGKNLGKMISLS